MPCVMAARRMVETPVPIFVVCRPKFTKLSTHVREWSPFAMPYGPICRFPFDDVLLCSGDIRDRVEKLSEIAPIFLPSPMS